MWDSKLGPIQNLVLDSSPAQKVKTMAKTAAVRSRGLEDHSIRRGGNIRSVLQGATMKHWERLKCLLQRKSLVRGSFTLASGKQSEYYLDCKLTTLDPEGAVLTGYSILELLASHDIRP